MLRRLARFTRPAGLSLLVILGMMAASCSRETKEQEAAEEATEHATTTPPQATNVPSAPDTALTDASIEAIVLAANTIDVKNGEVAQTKSKNDAVKTFATQMITDHTGVNAKVNELASKLNVMPHDNGMSRELTANANTKRNVLKAMTGAAFDKAYVDNEIAYHQAVLDLLDNTLVPRAQNVDLVALLESAHPLFVQHIDHAKAVQKALAR